MQKNTRKSKQVDQFTSDGVFIKRFDSMSAAGRETNVDNAAISRCCNGKLKQTGGFIWKYAQDKNQPKNNKLGELYDGINPLAEAVSKAKRSPMNKGDSTSSTTAPVHNDLRELYIEVRDTLKSYCVLDETYYDVITCWVIGTYFIRKVDHFPRLIVTSPTRGCGKSQVLKVMASLMVNAKQVVKPTPAVLYHLPKKDKPIRLIDEADEWLQSNDAREATEILNVGFEPGVMIERCGKNPGEIDEHDPFMPLVLAGISIKQYLKEATLSRCVTVNVFEVKNAKVKKAKTGELNKLHKSLRDRLDVLSHKLRSKFTSGKPPARGDGRMADAWAALFGVAAMAVQTPAITKAFEKQVSDAVEDDFATTVMKILKESIDHPDVKMNEPTASKPEYISTSCLYGVLSKNSLFKELNKGLTLRQFRPFLEDFEIEFDRTRFTGSSNPASAVNGDQLRKVLATF